MVGADHGAVDNLQNIRHGSALVQGVHDLVPQPGQCPATELAIDARPLSKLFRQIPPWSASSSDPENPVKDKSVVDRLAPVWGADGHEERLKNAHPSSGIRSRANLVSIADASLNHDQRDLSITFVNTA